MTSLREALERTGYSVGRYYSHAPGGFSYDYSCPGKGPMDHRHFETEDEAWAAAEKNLEREIKRARELIAAQALADNPVEDRRERIARIVDPEAWAVLDRYLAAAKRKYTGQDAGYDPEAFKDKASLAKADAIIAELGL